MSKIGARMFVSREMVESARAGRVSPFRWVRRTAMRQMREMAPTVRIVHMHIAPVPSLDGWAMTIEGEA